MSKAGELFSRIPRPGNCAQTVALGVNRPDLVPELAVCGGGRAPGGMCGALYAAKMLSRHPEELEALFCSQLGFSTCAELKAAAVACPLCVDTAGTLLEAEARFSK